MQHPPKQPRENAGHKSCPCGVRTLKPAVFRVAGLLAERVEQARLAGLKQGTVDNSSDTHPYTQRGASRTD